MGKKYCTLIVFFFLFSLFSLALSLSLARALFSISLFLSLFRPLVSLASILLDNEKKQIYKRD